MINNQDSNRNRLTGTGFTNIDRILKANENNRLGSTLQSGIEKEAKDAKQTLESETQSFQQQSQQNRLGTQADVQKKSNILDRFSAPSGFQDVTDQETKDFERFRSGEYKGPLELGKEQVQRAGSKAQQAQQLGNLTQTQGGRGELLKRFVGQEGYTRGQQNLDQLLLGKQSQDQLKGARRSTLGIMDTIGRQQETARGQGEQFRREAEEFGKQTRSALSDMFSQREEGLKTKTEGAFEGAKTARQNLFDKLSKEEQLSPEEVAQLGLTPEQEQQLNFLMDVSGSKYLSDIGISGQQYRFGDKYGKSALEASEQDKRYQDYLTIQNLLKDPTYTEGYRDYDKGSSGYAVERQVLSQKGFDRLKELGIDPTGLYENKQFTYQGPTLDRRYVEGNISGEDLFKYFQDPTVGKKLSEDIAKQLGLGSGEISSIGYTDRPDFEFERYLGKVDPNQFTRETVGTTDELTQINALRRLQGLEPLYDTSTAGTAPTMGASFLSQQALDDATRDLIGSGEITFNPDGTVTPTSNRALDLLNNIQQTSKNPFITVASIGSSPVVNAMANTLEPLAESGIGDFVNEISELGGDLNPIKIQSDIANLGLKYADEFGDSVTNKLAKVAGTVICTELHRQGIMSDEIYKKDREFGERFAIENNDAYVGYVSWALPVSRLMSKSKLLTNIIKPIAMAWANDMAGNPNKLGKLVMKVGVPVCTIIGKIVKKINKLKMENV